MIFFFKLIDTIYNIIFLSSYQSVSNSQCRYLFLQNQTIEEILSSKTNIFFLYILYNIFGMDILIIKAVSSYTTIYEIK